MFHGYGATSVKTYRDGLLQLRLDEQREQLGVDVLWRVHDDRRRCDRRKPALSREGSDAAMRITARASCDTG